MNRENTSSVSLEERETLERRWKTLATLVDLYEGASEASCYGPDRAEHLLRQQSSPEELRRIGVGESVIERLFGSLSSETITPSGADSEPTKASPARQQASFSVRVEARFESAHYLRNYRGITEPLHGHSYKVEAELERVGSGLDEDELAVDFVDARRQLEAIAERLDYGCINEVEPFDRLNPTAENVARWFHEELQRAMEHAKAIVTEIRLFEGPVNSVTYRTRR